MTIMKEIKFTMGQHGMAIDDRHTMLLADSMTFKVNHKFAAASDNLCDHSSCCYGPGDQHQSLHNRQRSVLCSPCTYLSSHEDIAGSRSMDLC